MVIVFVPDSGNTGLYGGCWVIVEVEWTVMVGVAV